jgi:hypothetical protein
MKIVLTPLSRTTVRLCEELDEVRYAPTVPAIAVGIGVGKVVLLVGRKYAEIPVYRPGDPRHEKANYLREQFLLHEAWHVLLGHDRRKGPRNVREWNLACDAAIHHRSQIDLSAIETTGLLPVTFERLGLNPCRPEVAYEQLVERQVLGVEIAGPRGCSTSDDLHSCGRPSEEGIRRLLGDSGPADTAEPREPQVTDAVGAAVVDSIMDGVREDCDARGEDPGEIERQFGTARYRGSDGSEGGNDCGRMRPTYGDEVPRWVADVLARLRPMGAGARRGRSYRREHRGGHPLVPGRARTGGVMPVFFLDASESISEEMAEEMLTALRLTAEFSDAVAYVFDERTRGPILAGETERVREAIAEAGGGTRLAGAWDDVAEHIDPGATRVWITDGFDHQWRLPEAWPDDLWVIGGGPWGPKLKVLTREELDAQLRGFGQ